MASISFHLKRPKSLSKTTIRALMSDGEGGRFFLPTGVSVKPNHFTKSKKVSSSDPNSVLFNKRLRDLETRLLEIGEEAYKSGIKISPSYVKERLRPKSIEAKSFWDLWEDYKNLKKRQQQPETFKKFRAIESHLKEYKGSLHLDGVNKALMENLHQFFLDRGYNKRTAGKNVKFVTQFLNYCFDRSYIKDVSWKQFKVTTPPDVVKVIITEEEMMKINSLDLNGKNYLDNTRALFELSCLTGLRYSDYTEVREEHLKHKNGNSNLEIHQKKTKGKVSIPLIKKSEKIVRGIIDGKYHPISNQKINIYLKELCKEAGINEPTEVIKDDAIEVKPKYELVGSHTGRRTFATRLLMKGVSAQEVMKFTGHKDYKSFMKYVNIPMEETMERVRKALA